MAYSEAAAAAYWAYRSPWVSPGWMSGGGPPDPLRRPEFASDVGTWSLGERMRGAPPRGAAVLSAFCWLTMFWKAAAWLLAAIRRCVFSRPAIKSKSVILKIILTVKTGLKHDYNGRELAQNYLKLYKLAVQLQMKSFIKFKNYI